MSKLVKPVFPMSDEEHDKYVNLAWEGKKMSIQEVKVREIIDKDIMDYYTGIMVAPTNDIFLQKIGVHFRFSDTVEAIFWARYNISLATFYAYKVQKFMNDEEGPEIECKDPAEVNLMLNKWLKVDAAPEDKGCNYCTDGMGKFSLLKSGLSWQLGENVPQNADVTGLTIADIDVYISDEDEGNNLELLVTNANDDPIIKEVVKIKYCPYCGRELGGK